MSTDNEPNSLLSVFAFLRAISFASPVVLLGAIAYVLYLVWALRKPFSPSFQAEGFPKGVTQADALWLMRENQALGLDLYAGYRKPLKPEPQLPERPVTSKQRLELHFKAMAEGRPQDSPYSPKSWLLLFTFIPF